MSQGKRRAPSKPGPARGDVWDVNLNPTLGHEQAGIRPALIVSADAMNRSPAELVIVCPISGTDRGIPAHHRVEPPEGGLDRPSVVMADQVRTISKARLVRRRGSVGAGSLRAIDDRLRLVLDL
jgi:mRNA interferase MazF